MTTLRNRRILAPLALSLLGALSGSGPTPVAPPITSVAAAPPTTAALPAATDSAIDEVRAHLLRNHYRTGLTRLEIEVLAETVVTEALRHDLDPSLVLAVIHVESRYNSFVVSSKNAIGLMQVVPATGEELADELGIRWEGPQTLFDPIANVRIGVAYLRQLSDRYDGDLSAALAAYNWGLGRIDRRIRSGAALPTLYPRLVLDAYGDTAGRS
jgi:soluble lytic murein transglycosylase-like protein